MYNKLQFSPGNTPNLLCLVTRAAKHSNARKTWSRTHKRVTPNRNWTSFTNLWAAYSAHPLSAPTRLWRCTWKSTWVIPALPSRRPWRSSSVINVRRPSARSTDLSSIRRRTRTVCVRSGRSFATYATRRSCRRTICSCISGSIWILVEKV